MVVDDQTDTREFITTVLEQCQAEVKAVAQLHLPKPIEAADLATVVASLVGRT